MSEDTQVAPEETPAPEAEAPQDANPAPEAEGGEQPQQPEPPKPVELTLSNAEGKTAIVRVPAEVAQAILEYEAPAVVYLAAPGEKDPDALNDEFSRPRQHVINAVHELQNAALAHPILSQPGEIYSHAHQVAFQGVALVYNMLVQAGIAVREQAEMMARFQAEQEAAAARQVDGDTPVADLGKTDAHGGTILG